MGEALCPLPPLGSGEPAGGARDPGLPSVECRATPPNTIRPGASHNAARLATTPCDIQPADTLCLGFMHVLSRDALLREERAL